MIGGENLGHGNAGIAVGGSCNANQKRSAEQSSRAEERHPVMASKFVFDRRKKGRGGGAASSRWLQFTEPHRKS